MGLVYFAADGKSRIKVGFTNNLRRRFQELRSQSGVTEILGTFRGTMGSEKAVHRALSAHHVEGEWFSDCEGVRTFLKRSLNKTADELNLHALAHPSRDVEEAIAEIRRMAMKLVDLAEERLGNRMDAYKEVGEACNVSAILVRRFINEYAETGLSFRTAFEINNRYQQMMKKMLSASTFLHSID